MLVSFSLFMLSRKGIKWGGMERTPPLPPAPVCVGVWLLLPLTADEEEEAPPSPLETFEVPPGAGAPFWTGAPDDEGVDAVAADIFARSKNPRSIGSIYLLLLRVRPDWGGSVAFSSTRHLRQG